MSYVFESFVQECGRAGRKGESSTCILLYNGRLMKNCEEDIKNYAASSVCRRKEIRSSFSLPITQETAGCYCCDICAIECNGNYDGCLLDLFLPMRSGADSESSIDPIKLRQVSNQDRKLLKEMLESYRLSLLSGYPDVIPVSYPTMYLEFSALQVAQAVNKCEKIFTLQGVKTNFEICRNVYAYNILAAIHDIFKDFEIDKSKLQLLPDDDPLIRFDEDSSKIWDESVYQSLGSTFFDNLDTTDQDTDVSMDTTVSHIMTN